MTRVTAWTEIEYIADITARLQTLSAQPWFVLLDSCAGSGMAGRWDIAAWQPHTTLLTRGRVTEIRRRGRSETSSADPFSIVRDLVGDAPPAGDLPFHGGAIGFFSYDLARRIERLPEHSVADIDAPELAVGIYDRFIVNDHETRRSWFGHCGIGSAEVTRCLQALSPSTPLTPAAYAGDFVVNDAVRSDMTYDDYARALARIKRYIRAGDCYQVNFAQRFSAPASGDPWHAYQRLRLHNPAPFAAFLRMPGSVILSSSPERFLAVRDGRVTTRPIKGTRGRAADPSADRVLREQLAASIKDRAENLMIVDLLRNDLGRVCTTGSVSVPALFEVESYARVHHLVSTIHGRLADGVHAAEALRACFPGGSITGAPKIRAMEIIDELEPTRRNVYCGAIGYLSHDGQMDTNIAIRTLLYHQERLYCWAGGGIVDDSRIEDEYQESLDKAAAMLSVFRDAEARYLGR